MPSRIGQKNVHVKAKDGIVNLFESPGWRLALEHEKGTENSCRIAERKAGFE